VPGEGGVVVEGDGSSQATIDPTEYGEHHRDGFGGGFAGQSRTERHARLSLVQDEHGPGVLADNEIPLSMAGLGAGIDDFRPIVNRSTILDRVARAPWLKT
jgi:hypothetical protein